MKQMTKNEYHEYMCKNANRIYTEPGYSIEQFYKDADDVTVLPFDLSKYTQLDKKTKEWISALFVEETVDKHGNYMLRGRTYREMSEIDLLGLYYGDYCTTYSIWAYNDESMLIYTYCEGDTTLQIFDNKETYEAEKAESLAWYREAAS